MFFLFVKHRQTQKERQRCGHQGYWQDEISHQAGESAAEWGRHITGNHWYQLRVKSAHYICLWFAFTLSVFLVWSLLSVFCRICITRVSLTWSACLRRLSGCLSSWRSCTATCWRWSFRARRANCLNESPSSSSRRSASLKHGSLPFHAASVLKSGFCTNTEIVR